MLVYKVKRGIEVNLYSVPIYADIAYIPSDIYIYMCEYILMHCLMYKHIHKYLYAWTSQNMSESSESD